jgi:hypothetical protein
MKSEVMALAREREDLRKKLEAAAYHSAGVGATSTSTKKVRPGRAVWLCHQAAREAPRGVRVQLPGCAGRRALAPARRCRCCPRAWPSCT